MELRTYTRLWNVEKRIYKVYDFTLPMPIPVKTLGVIVLVGGPWIALMFALNAPFHPPWQILWFGPPVGLSLWASKPVAEGKRLLQLVTSQLRYVLQPRTFAALRPWNEPTTVTPVAEVWHPGTIPTYPDADDHTG